MKKLSHILLVLFSLCLVVSLSSCSDTKISNPFVSKAADTAGLSDTDGDGLVDDVELLSGTSPVLADTDGDGLGDEREIVELGFDPAIDPVNFNPLVADIPRLGIILKSPPVVRLILTDTLAVSKVFEVDRTVENAVAVDQAVTESVVDTIEVSQTASQSTTFTNGVAGDTTLSFDISKTMTQDVSFSFSKTQTVENVQSITEIEAFSKTHEISASGGLLKIQVGLVNLGNVPFTIQHVVLSALIPDPVIPGKFFPVANLIFDSSGNYTGFPTFTIPPGGVFPAVTFINDTLDLETAKMLLRNPGALVITVATLELTDVNGIPFAFNFTDIEARDALVVIDYSGKRLPEKFFVAANSDPLSPGITAGRALRDVLHIPFETATSASGSPAALTGLRNDPAVRGNTQNGFWLVVQTRNNGLGNIVARFDPRAGDFDFENILLKAGDVLYLVWMEDRDGDGIFSRQERLLGTNDLVADSDNDGLDDFFEIFVAHTDPNKPDTDGDGVIDGKDAYPLDPGLQ